MLHTLASRLPLRFNSSSLCQRPIQNHQTHNLIQRISGRHRRQLRVRVVSRGHLDHIRRNQVDSLQPPHNRPQLPRTPPTCLWRPSRRRKCWIERVYVYAQINGILMSNPFMNFLDDPFHANSVNLPRFDDMEAAVSVILIV